MGTWRVSLRSNENSPSCFGMSSCCRRSSCTWWEILAFPDLSSDLGGTSVQHPLRISWNMRRFLRYNFQSVILEVVGYLFNSCSIRGSNSLSEAFETVCISAAIDVTITDSFVDGFLIDLLSPTCADRSVSLDAQSSTVMILDVRGKFRANRRG